jgi:carboxypeptidase family protein/TonB-dependent receptor-like protein
MFNLGARVRACVLVVFYALLIVSNGFSQVVTGAILGRVTDTTGAVVPSASVQIQNVDTGFSQSVQTDSGGRYLSRNLPLGNYSVTVQQAGFQTQVRSGISLSVGSEVVVNVEMAVGAVQEKVEVVGEAPAIETTNATISNLVSQEQMRDLPLNGRSVDNLALLSPGVFSNRTTQPNQTVGMGVHLSINGARPDSVLYLLDGTTINDSTANGHGSAAGTTMGVEGILEFRIITHNFTAEYGRNGGGVISSVTRAGTNELHGSAYEFVRNNIFDARNFFNPGDLPAFRRNQFGGAAGGRIFKDKLFFFANYEGLRQRQGITSTSSVPDLNARKGLLPNAAGVPTPVTLSPAAVPYLNLYPLPNGPSNGDGTALYITGASTLATEDYTMGRMDYRISDKDSFYGRYIYDPAYSSRPEAVPVYQSSVITTDHLAMLSETHIFSGASLNEFRFAMNRMKRGQDSHPTIAVPPSLLFVPGLPFGTITFAQSGSNNTQLSQLGSNQGADSHAIVNLFQESDTFSTVRGRHSLKFGVDFERQDINNSVTTSSRGAYQFGGLGALMAGTPSVLRLELSVAGSVKERGWRRNFFATFVQDDFRVRPNLTLNLGLRYEVATSPVEVHGFSGNLINITDAKNTPGPPFLTPKANFAPRGGVAWDPTGSGKTSIRAGGGIFFQPIDGRNWFQQSSTESDYNKTVNLSNPPFPNGLAAAQALGGPIFANGRVQFHTDMGAIYHYSFEVQRQLVRTLSLRAGYVGSQGRHLPIFEEDNIRIPTILGDGSKFWPTTAPLTNAGYPSVPTITTHGRSAYNGLQAALQKTFSAGLMFQLSYTYSKAQSNGDEITTGQALTVPSAPVDITDLNRDYSRSAYDQRHIISLNFSYQMPWEKHLNGRLAKSTLGGWSINGIYQYGSGVSGDILDGFNNARDNNPNSPDRPDLTPGFSNDPIHGVTAGCLGIPAGQKLHTPARWYDPCAFTLSSAGTYGNLGRLTVTMPGLSVLDFTLVKVTPITERKKLEFRAEFFNFFNHANFGLPVLTTFSSTRARTGNAGLITNTTTQNREIQLGMKLVF